MLLWFYGLWCRVICYIAGNIWEESDVSIFRVPVLESDCVPISPVSYSYMIPGYTLVYFSIYVTVILLVDGRQTRPKHVVEDKWMRSAESVACVLIIKTHIPFITEKYYPVGLNLNFHLLYIQFTCFRWTWLSRFSLFDV